jgi:segregation and condensation protein A
MPDVNTSQLVNHLLFHKALIAEDDAGERIEGYMDMIKKIDSGTHIMIEDEFEKSISLVLELVMEEHFDCWDIDLVKFSKLYLKRIRKESSVDLITAGKIVLMAWSILKLQSDVVLSKADVVEEVDEFFFEGWNVRPEEFRNSSETPDYTNVVISGKRIPIQERIMHRSDRPVTLMELMDAFSEAKQDVERHKRAREQRIRLSEMMKQDEDFDEKVHNENLEEDIYTTWQRICMIEDDKMLLNDLIDGSRDDLISRFISVLYLAIENRISIRQRRFPYGEIIITNTTPVEERLKSPTVELVTSDERKPERDSLLDQLVIA